MSSKPFIRSATAPPIFHPSWRITIPSVTTATAPVVEIPGRASALRASGLSPNPDHIRLQRTPVPTKQAIDHCTDLSSAKCALGDTQSVAGGSVASPAPTPELTNWTHNLQNFARVGHEIDTGLFGKEEKLDLSFWDEYLANESQSLSSSPEQPLTPSHNPSFHTLKALNCKEPDSEHQPIIIYDSDDDEVVTERHSELASPQRNLRARPTKFAVVEHLEDDLWIDGPIVNSVERSPTAKPDVMPQFDDDHWPVDRIVGERRGPGFHEFRVQWDDGTFDWKTPEACYCPRLISDWRALQQREVIGGGNTGQNMNLHKLLRLAELDQVEIDNLAFPRRGRLRHTRRGPTGAFAQRGTRNSRIEITRLPTVPPQDRRNTARRPNRQDFTESSGYERRPGDDEIIWLYTQPTPRRNKLLEGTRKKARNGKRNYVQPALHREVELRPEVEQEENEKEKCFWVSEVGTIGYRGERNLAMEKVEMERRKQTEADEKRIIEERVAATDERRAAKAHRRAENARLREEFRNAKRMLQEREEEEAQRKAKKKEKKERKAARRAKKLQQREQRAQMILEEDLRVKKAAEKAEAEERTKEFEKEREAKQIELEETVRRGRKKTPIRTEVPIVQMAEAKKHQLDQTIQAEATLVHIHPSEKRELNRATLGSIKLEASGDIDLEPHAYSTRSATKAQDSSSRMNQKPKLDQGKSHAGQLAESRKRKHDQMTSDHRNSEVLRRRQDRAYSIVSTMSNGTKFTRLRANESLARSNERPRLVQAAFRGSLSEREVEARFNHANNFSRTRLAR